MTAEKSEEKKAEDVAVKLVTSAVAANTAGPSTVAAAS